MKGNVKVSSTACFLQENKARVYLARPKTVPGTKDR
jgi:hypothetical protein